MQRQKTGTFLHSSAAAHAKTLTHILDNYEVKQSEIQNALKHISQLPKSNIVDPESPSVEVVQMKTNDDLSENLRRELKHKNTISKVFPPVVGTYSPVSLQFENSPLFLPSVVEFTSANQDTVREFMPDMHMCTVNSFAVSPNNHAFGVHNAGSVGFEIPSFAQKGLGYPKKHWSFHTALTRTSLDKQPFCIFDDAVAEGPNLAYLYDQLQSYDLTTEERENIDKFYYLCMTRMITTYDITGARNYLVCKYFEKHYASRDDQNAGYYWDLEPGQALFFDNYQPHGDSTLPLSEHERLSIDLRCYTKVEYPDGMKSGVDFLQGDALTQRVKAKRKSLDCILRVIGYEDIDEFLKLIYGSKYNEVDIFEMTTDPQFGVYNKTEYYLLDQDLEPHFEKIHTLYEKMDRDGEFVIPKKQQEAIMQLSQQ
ncbi:hypothetical protein MNBD_GAMMA12-3912 [hydrothermal vent metagenome]|uniref:Uncharacterized protein n=1 Tax=hydrothermal vent metagenome TaxID=652676 RepID=A0A3B0XUS1_9ZZZZ